LHGAETGNRSPLIKWDLPQKGNAEASSSVPPSTAAGFFIEWIGENDEGVDRFLTDHGTVLAAQQDSPHITENCFEETTGGIK
jgi:hypothetical protein